MSRLRITFMTAAMLLAVAALTLNSLAQQPPGGGRGGAGGGGGRGGFGGGRGGFGGGPGGGFGGPGGGSLLMLASNAAVQTDLKLKDKQKVQIKSLTDKYNTQMQEMRTQFGMGGPGGRGGAQGKGQGRGQNGANAQAQNGQAGGFGGGGGAGGFGGGGGGGGQGQDPNAQAGGAGGRGNRGNRGNRNQNGQGVPEDPAVVAQRNEQRQMAREAMDELRQGAESSLAKILDRNQVTRLKQISLQLEGPDAVLCQNATHPHGDMIDKLQIDEAQYAMIREVMSESRNIERASRKTRGEMMKNAFARLNPNGANGGGGQGNAGNGNGNGGGAGNNGNNGGNGGGRGGRGNFDPEAMRKLMESPEMKAQMEEIRTQEQKLTAQTTLAISKILSPRQRSTFKRMLGATFDRSAMMAGGGMWGGRGGAAGKAAAKGATVTKDDDDDDDDAPKAKPSTTAAPVKSKSSSASKRKSLRELRGDPGNDN